MAELFASKLPDAPWTRRADLGALIAALGPGNARYVGGAVRDTLLGLAVKDVDIATSLTPEAVMKRCGAAGLRTIPTGIAHGTITAALAGGAVEITTLRRDVATDGRHATVAFAESWREDAARRDFTINALYADPASGEISDWFGGLADLAARRVRFIGHARQRIREDHLRILRYFRFRARFGSEPADAEAEAACAELAPMLMGLSRERVRMELMNLLGVADPGLAVARMAELGVLAVILPEARADAVVEALPALVREEARQDVAPDALRRLAALLPADADGAGKVAARLRLSTAQAKRLGHAAARGGDADDDAHALAYRLGRVSATDCLLLTGREVAPLAGWSVPVFPLKGGEIVARGVSAGPEVARILRAIEARWVAEGFPGKPQVTAWLDAMLAQSTA